MVTLGERIRQLRKEKGFNQNQLGEKLGVDDNTVSKWELGTQMPSPENIAKLTELFDIPLAYLGGSSDDRSFREIGDELAAASAAEDDREYLKHMVKIFSDLSPEGQKYIKVTLSAVWKNEREEGRLQSQQGQ